MELENEKEFLEIILEQSSIFDKIEKEYLKIKDLIEEFKKTENKFFEKNLWNYEECKIGTPRFLIQNSFNQVLADKIENFDPLNIKIELGFERDFNFFIKDLLPIIEKSRYEDDFKEKIEALLSTYHNDLLKEIFENFKK